MDQVFRFVQFLSKEAGRSVRLPQQYLAYSRPGLVKEDIAVHIITTAGKAFDDI